MSKEAVAVIALGLSLIAAVFGFGMRIGTLTERIDSQSRQLEVLSKDVRAINEPFIRWVGTHPAPPTPARRPR